MTDDNRPWASPDDIYTFHGTHDSLWKLTSRMKKNGWVPFQSKIEYNMDTQVFGPVMFEHEANPYKSVVVPPHHTVVFVEDTVWVFDSVTNARRAVRLKTKVTEFYLNIITDGEEDQVYLNASDFHRVMSMISPHTKTLVNGVLQKHNK